MSWIQLQVSGGLEALMCMSIVAQCKTLKSWPSQDWDKTMSLGY